MELGDARPLAEAQLDTTVTEEVEGADAFRDARGMVGRQLDDAVGESDLLRPLAGGGEEDFRGGGMGILLQEMVLDLPGVVVSELVRELDLGERVLEQIVFSVRGPGSGKLMLVEDSELHGGLLVSGIHGWNILPRIRTPVGVEIHVGSTISSVHTGKFRRVLGPKVVVIATSAASRPRAIRTRPMRGMLLRGSKVCQWLAEIGLEPSGEIARRMGRWHADIPQIAGAVARGNIQGPAERNGQMGEVPTYAVALLIGFRRRFGHACDTRSRR